MIKFLVDSAKGINTSKINKEVNPMTEETTQDVAVEKTDAVVENVEVAPEADAKADTVEAVTEEITEKAAKAHPDKESPAEDATEPANAETMEEVRN